MRYVKTAEVVVVSYLVKIDNLIQKVWSFPAKKCVPNKVYGASP
nr:MAG TPA: hypothetical protein [Caudoviricetes sp.]